MSNHQHTRIGLKKATKEASNLDEEDHLIQAVLDWDGETNIWDDDNDDDGDADAMEIDTPDQIEIIYAQATPLLNRLLEHPNDQALIDELEELNGKIKVENPSGKWEIPTSFFKPHYQLVSEQYTKLKEDTENEAAKEVIQKTKSVIEQEISKYHFPKSWSIPGADEYLAEIHAKDSAQKPGSDSNTSRPGHIEYPWVTKQVADTGLLIIGIRRQGWGTRVCVEAQEKDGRVIRRLESALNIGPAVDEYKNLKGYKNLAEGQSSWSRADEGDSPVLLWVTNSSPTADCCVQFRSKGIQILTVTSFTKIFGRQRARAAIENVCRRDRIPVPWDRYATRNSVHEITEATSKPLTLSKEYQEEILPKSEENGSSIKTLPQNPSQDHQKLEAEVAEMKVMMAQILQLLAAKSLSL